MAIIYSYPLNDDIRLKDELVGTTEKVVNGQLKTVTRNFLLEDLSTFFINKGGIQKTIILTTAGSSGPATLNTLTGELNIPQYLGVTNLSYTPAVSQGTINSNTGDDAIIPLADTINAGLFLAIEKAKLAAITGTNTGDQNLQSVTDLGSSTTKPITANSFIKSGGTSAQLLAANGDSIKAGTNITIDNGEISSIGGSGGSSVNFYLNGSIASGVAGYKQIGSSAIIGGGTDFTLIGNGTIAQFLTDIGTPNRLEIPSGAWNFELWLQSSSNNSNTNVFVELYKYNGAFTLIASNSSNPIVLQRNTTTNLYLTSLAILQTTLLTTDRLAVRIISINSNGNHSVTLHTEDSNLCEILTNFVGGIVSINGITQPTQMLATGTTGTDFTINSSGSTHTFNLPNASTNARGVVTINDQSFSGLKNFTDNIIVNGININRGSNNGTNIAIGEDALDNNTGNQNTIIGFQAASNNNATPLGTSFNTVLGYQAYSNGAANNNTAIGWQSLFSSAANNNSALGYSSGLFITTGFQNTFIGAYAGGITGQLISAQNSIAIGYNAITTKSNQVVLGNSSITETVLRGKIDLDTVPTTSVGNYDILTRNISTGIIEKILSSNVGTITLSAIGSTPNANGAIITGSVLSLQPANASFGGVMTVGAQTFAGAKTFSNNITANANIVGTNTPDISNPSYSIIIRNASTGVFEKLGATTIQPLIYNILITSEVGITTQHLGINGGLEYSQDGRNVMIANGTVPIQVTATNASSSFIASYTKLGTGNITFATSGTLVAPYGAVLNGNIGSTALLTKNGNTVYVLVNNLL